MYCPKCGQQQVSDEMRFCSRCGFQLGVVTALIAGNGIPPAALVTDVQDEKRLARRLGARQGAKLMFAGGVLSPIALGFSILFESPLPLLIPFTIFLAGLAWMLYYRLFGEETAQASQATSPSQLNAAQESFLPASQGAPVANINKPSASTAEIAQPFSVTENTTRLLDDK
jgi:hypothetical protein